MKIFIYVLIYTLIGIFFLIFGILRVRKINIYEVIKVNRKNNREMQFDILKKGIYSIWICTNSRFRSVNISDFLIYNKYTNIRIYPSIYPYRNFKLKSRIELGTFRINKGSYNLNFNSNKDDNNLEYFYVATGRSYFYKIMSFIILILGFIMMFSGIMYCFSFLIS